MRYAPRKKGFTLIELIAVMALLTTVMAIVAPSLAKFMGGRALDEEARRFLALTQYARSEAVSRAVVFRLWVEKDSGAYGLSPETRPESADARALEYHLADGLHFELSDDAGDRFEILFWPDGALDDAAASEVRILDEDDRGFSVLRKDYGMGYALEAWNGDV